MIQTTPIVVERISSSNWPNWAFTGLSALAALAVALSTLASHRWVRLQRRPRLQLIEGALELRSNQICAVEFAFANPGNVPIIVKSAAIAAYKGFRNYEVHIGKKLAVYPDPEQVADPNRRIHSRDVGHVEVYCRETRQSVSLPWREKSADTHQGASWCHSLLHVGRFTP